MLNLLMKNLVMNNSQNGEMTAMSLKRVVLKYDYLDSISIAQGRFRHQISYYDKLSFNEPIHLEYGHIKFNMITCPAGYIDIVDISSSRGPIKIEHPYMLGETEVTQELFETVMRFNYSKNKEPNNPVENVSWFDCLEFCNRLSDYFGLKRYYTLNNMHYRSKVAPMRITGANFEINPESDGFRLPMEWEWQLAAMAGTNNKYAGTNSEDSLSRFAWIKSNSDEHTHPVAQKLPNEWGFYDMNGNVNEWCQNAYNHFSEIPSSDHRVRRGGNYQSDHSKYLDFTSTDNRDHTIMYAGTPTIGLRIAKNLA